MLSGERRKWKLLHVSSFPGTFVYEGAAQGIGDSGIFLTRLPSPLQMVPEGSVGGLPKLTLWGWEH